MRSDSALLAMGLEAEPHTIEPVDGRMRARATTADGTELDVDIHSRDAWDSQLVVKLWRWLWYRSDGPGVAVTRRQQMEHQAFVTLLAERRGAAVAPVIAAAIDARGDALLVSEHVGVELSDRAHQIADAELAACWASLAQLGDAGIRHGAITADHLRVVGEVVYLSDLDRAVVGSDDESRRLDEAQLLITTAVLVGPERATAAALDALGPERLAAVTSFIQPAVLTPVMRKEAAAAGLDVDEFRKAVVAAAGGEEQELQQLRRFSLGGVDHGCPAPHRRRHHGVGDRGDRHRDHRRLGPGGEPADPAPRVRHRADTTRGRTRPRSRPRPRSGSRSPG